MKTKNLLRPLIVLFIISSAFANRTINEKVLQAFNDTFKEVQNVKWDESSNHFSAYFVKNGIRASITYDKDGNFISSRRYYDEDHLPLVFSRRITMLKPFGPTP